MAPSQIFLSISLSPTDLWFELIHFPENQIEPINSKSFDYYVMADFCLKNICSQNFIGLAPSKSFHLAIPYAFIIREKVEKK